METEKILQAVRDSISDHSVDYLRRYAKPTTSEQAVCESMGALTIQVTSRLTVGRFGPSPEQTRRALNKLVRQGLLLKSVNNGGNCCRWWPVGHLQQLQASA